MSPKKDYIEQMVSDTFGHLEGSNVIQFPKRQPLPDGQLEMEFGHHEAMFDSKRMCLCIAVHSKVVEIPVNWGPFGQLDFFHLEKLDFVLNKNDDEEQLLEVLSPLFGIELESLSLRSERSGLVLEVSSPPATPIAA